MTYAVIAGTGSYLPEQRVSNHDLEKRIDTSDEWIVTRTGISSRRVAATDETTSSLAHLASLNALGSAGINAHELDMIIVATCTPENHFPSVACVLQKHLGIESSIPAFDVSAACSGFVYAIDVAKNYIENNRAKNILVVGSEVMSQAVDWEDRTTCILFGDGAGAVVLSASDKPGILSSITHAQGLYEDLLKYPNNSLSQNSDQRVKMSGNEVFKLAVNTMGEIVEEILAESKLQKADIDWLIPHQANLRIIKATAKKLDMPLDRVIITLNEQGNTSAASIPIALDTGIKDGRIKRGDVLLLESFGGGLTWGANIIVY
jgi:3-oxoacyl-[acyl-carrier-protein] synthase-3